jgi:hypothetical protein
MNERLKIFLLTVLQIMMILLGIGLFLVVKFLLQKFGINAAMIDVLNASIVGMESFWNTHIGIFFLVLYIPIMLIIARNAASIFYRSGRKIRQMKRDSNAKSLVEQLQRGKQMNFSLYLRSFEQESSMKRKKNIWWYILLEGDIFGIDRETLDLMISSEVNSSFPMIAVGQSGEKLGAGRMSSTGKKWWDLIVLLMDRAKVMFIIPGTSKGVIKEMEYLYFHHYEKTIIIMPPLKYYHGSLKAIENHWEHSKQVLGTSGIHLPIYNPTGALCIINNQGQIIQICQFESRFGNTHICNLIQQMGISKHKKDN